MSYFIQKNRSIAEPRVIACRLDSKARLVLPLVVRDKLSVSKGDILVFEIEFSGSQALLKISKGKKNGLKQFCKNGWEK
ncbi:MAG: hypothetical protein V1811_03170 [Candidatus Micrarchaeota archaeon]